MQNHLETFLARCHDDWEDERISAHVERELRRFPECGILAYGFGRARCGQCGHDFLVAFSCKGRAVCPSCNARRMAETAAHLIDHVLKEMQLWSHGGGFSLDATVRIAANDQPGLERLLRYGARGPFAAERLEDLDRHRLIHNLPKPGPHGRTQLIISPPEPIERIAALVPPPRQHRHRYFGVLAPNAPLRAAPAVGGRALRDHPSR